MSAVGGAGKYLIFGGVLRESKSPTSFANTHSILAWHICNELPRKLRDISVHLHACRNCIALKFKHSRQLESIEFLVVF